MRHRKRHSKFSMRTSQRVATLRNMVRSLLQYQKIETIKARAKEARRLAERVISLTKDDTVASRRLAYSVLGERDLVVKLFKEIGPLFKDRTSGFTRIIPIGFRRGDGADMVILELTEKTIVAKKEHKKKSKKAVEGQGPKAKDQAEEKRPEDKKEEAKKEELKTKEIPKSKPTLAEEKRHEKAKSEDRKAADHRGFMKNLRGLFRKRGDR